MISDSMINQLCSDKRCGVMATIISSDGQGPAKKGDCLFWSRGKRIAGTVGGGANEQQVLQACADLTVVEQVVEIDSFLPGPLPSCGGKLCVQLKRVDFAKGEDAALWRKRQQKARQSRIFLLGAGHVVQEVAWLADRNDFQVVIVDPRRKLLTAENFPAQSTCIATESTVFFQENSVEDHDFIVIAGPAHATDLTALEQATLTPAHYIGVLGSSRKIGSFEAVLREKNLWNSLAGRLHAPIGIPISSRKPAEVALSIVVELVQVRARLYRCNKLDEGQSPLS